MLNTKISSSRLTGTESSSCDGCKWYLGGGLCRLNAETECAAGGGFELYEQKEE